MSNVAKKSLSLELNRIDSQMFNNIYVSSDFSILPPTVHIKQLLTMTCPLKGTRCRCIISIS